MLWCIIKHIWPQDPGFSVKHNRKTKTHNLSTLLRGFCLNMAFFWNTKHAHVKSSILYQTSHLHTECCKSREKTSVCPMSSSSLRPTNLEDKSLMSRSAYSVQSALCLPETAVTQKMYCSLDNASWLFCSRSCKESSSDYKWEETRLMQWTV